MGIFFNIAGDSDINESADIGLNRGAGFIEGDFVGGGMEDHGIMAAGSGIVRSNDSDDKNFDFLGFKGKSAGGNLNPAGTGPTVVLILNAFDLNRSAFVVGDNKILGGTGNSPGGIGIVADLIWVVTPPGLTVTSRRGGMAVKPMAV